MPPPVPTSASRCSQPTGGGGEAIRFDATCGEILFDRGQQTGFRSSHAHRRHGRPLVASARLAHDVADGFAYRLDVGNVLFDDRRRRQRLYCVALDAVAHTPTATLLAQFEQLDRSGADIQPEQRQLFLGKFALSPFQLNKMNDLNDFTSGGYHGRNAKPQQSSIRFGVLNPV